MLFEFIREVILPFQKMVPYIPSSGSLIDVGCGHGFLSLIIAKDSPKRKVLGIDPAADKIQKAKQKAKGFKNLSFKKIYTSQVKRSSFDVAVMADVLCLLPPAEQIKILKDIHKILKRKGVFVLKEVENKPRWFFYWIKIEEYLMQSVFKLTYAEQKGLYITDKEGYKKLLKKAGFKIKKTAPIRGLLPYPHILFVATK